MGIGSLPSATNITWAAPIPGLVTGVDVFGIAPYMPANATAVRTISAVLFMGEFSSAQIFTPGEVYASAYVICGGNLWITINFRPACGEGDRS